MSRSWTNLPLEVIQLVFEHVEKKSDLLHCQLTCRSWTSTAKIKFYKNFTLLGEKHALMFLIYIIDSPDNVGNLVKCFHFDFGDSYNYISTFYLFFQLCPNVQVFNLIGSGCYGNYWSTMMNELSRGYWPQLKYIPSSVSEIEKYVNVVLECTSVLNSLTVCLSGRETADNFNKLVQNLPRFSNLKEIEIEIDLNTMEISNLEKVLNSNNYNPNLERISFNRNASSRFRPSDFRMDLPSVQPYQNVKVFETGEIVFTDYFLNYLMHKFPQLCKLTLKENVYTSDRPVISASVMSSFLQYLSRIETMGITLVVSGHISAMINTIIQPVLKDIFPKITVNYIGYQEQDDDEYEDGVTPKCSYIKIHNGVALYGQNSVIHRPNIIEITIDRIDLDNPPHIGIAKMFKNRLEELELICDPEGDRESLLTQVTGDDINTIMEVSQQLKVLTIDNFEVYLNNYGKEYRNECIHTLNFVFCCFGMDTLSLLSSNLVALKNLSFEGIPGGMNDDWGGRIYKIDMPHTLFDNIFWITIDTTSLTAI